MRFYMLLFSSFIFVLGCTKSCGSKHSAMSPEQVVEAYLDTALNMKNAEQKPYLMRYTTGNLKYALETATDETILKAYVKRQFKIEEYSVVERTDRRPREVEIVFQLSFKELTDQPEDETPLITTENTVSVVKENNLWLISNVLGKKTSIDFPISAESVIKAAPGPGIDEEVIDDEIYDNDDDMTTTVDENSDVLREVPVDDSEGATVSEEE